MSSLSDLYNNSDSVSIAPSDSVSIAPSDSVSVAPSVGSRISGAVSSVGSTISEESSGLLKKLDVISPQKVVSETKQFLNSNSILAKIAFIALVIIVFFILLRIGTAILNYAFSPSLNPILVKGTKDAKKSLVIPQNPNKNPNSIIERSKNKSGGIEFTYSTWLNIDDLEYKKGEYRHVFHKGNDNITMDENEQSYGLNFPNNAPGVYIHPNKNALVIIMNTFKKINEEIIVESIPLNKWINVVIRVKGKNVDVYINGNMTLRHKLSSVPKQNYGDVYVNMNGGYSGHLSSLRYFNHALTTNEILSLSKKGPNLKMERNKLDIYPPYFSLRWYFQNAN